jgi:2,3-bisphosphoglycerate-independent phosphoglycerate mutase
VTKGAGVKPVVLIVMDGYGCNDNPEGNAVSQAATPVLDRLVRECPHGLLKASGLAVGLPAGQMGNSEVGHLNMGAGSVVYQDFTRVSRAIEDGTFFDSPALLKACRHAVDHDSTLHVVGLVGYGGVHAHQEHLYAVLELAKRAQVRKLAIHAFTDGRDTLPHDALAAIRDLEARLSALQLGAIATLSGRYYAMDRDRRWDRTQKAYLAMTAGEGEQAESATAAIEGYYDAGTTDEFILPTVIRRDGKPVAMIADGDAVIFFNFRTDRPRQLVRAFVMPDFEGFERPQQIQDLLFATMTEYEKELPVAIAFASQDVKVPLARVVSENGLTQLHAAETEKYAHVTFFFNGGRETPFEGEDRILVPSPRHVGTYDKMPEMSAEKIAGQVAAAVRDHDYGFVLVNFANADMVGHTGSMEATVRAVETVDHCVGEVLNAAVERGGAVLITADHGNAEQMIDYQTGGPFTSHTIEFPVPFVFVPGNHEDLRSCTIRDGGVLADVAPTVLDLMDLPTPAEMEGDSLLNCGS